MIATDFIQAFASFATKSDRAFFIDSKINPLILSFLTTNPLCAYSQRKSYNRPNQGSKSGLIALIPPTMYFFIVACYVYRNK